MREAVAAPHHDEAMLIPSCLARAQVAEARGDYERHAFRVLPQTPYPIPHAGPVGGLLDKTARSPLRASHLDRGISFACPRPRDGATGPGGAATSAARARPVHGPSRFPCRTACHACCQSLFGSGS